MKLIPYIICLSDKSARFVGALQVENTATITECAEILFARFNAGSGKECEEFLSSRCRSMSVGDFIKINGEILYCASFGWKVVTEETFAAWFEEMDEIVTKYGTVYNEAIFYATLNLRKKLNLTDL